MRSRSDSRAPLPLAPDDRPPAAAASELTPRPGVVAAALVATALAAGCADHRLPEAAVPTEKAQPQLPWWHGQAGWTAASGVSRVYITGQIQFHNDSAVIKEESKKYVLEVKAFLAAHPDVTRLRIEGHTDSRASDEYNLDLSARRVLAVSDYLVDQGVDHTRLIAVSFGEKRPVGPNESAVGRADNRRVEFHVAEVDGRPFLKPDPYAGGFPHTVKSLAEREAEARAAREAKVPKARPPYQGRGEGVFPLPYTPPPPREEDDTPVIRSAPAPNAGPAKKEGDKGG